MKTNSTLAAVVKILVLFGVPIAAAAIVYNITGNTRAACWTAGPLFAILVFTLFKD